MVLAARYRAVPTGPWRTIASPPVFRLGWDGAVGGFNESNLPVPQPEWSPPKIGVVGNWQVVLILAPDQGDLNTPGIIERDSAQVKPHLTPIPPHVTELVSHLWCVMADNG